MRFWQRWEVTLGAGFYSSKVGYMKPQYYPFHWMAKLRCAIWKTLNLFPGRLTATVRRVR